MHCIGIAMVKHFIYITLYVFHSRTRFNLLFLRCKKNNFQQKTVDYCWQIEKNIHILYV